MFPFRKPSPFTRIADQTSLRLLPRAVDAVTLRGFLAEPGMPFAPPPADDVQVVTSPVTHQVFPARQRDELDSLVGVHCWSDADALTADLAAGPSDLLIRFPAEFTPSEFPGVFGRLALVSLTHNRLAGPLGHNASHAHLHVPHADTDVDGEPLAVPVALHILLSRSDGSTDLPTLMISQVRGDLDALSRMTSDLCGALPYLLGHRVAALVDAR